MVTFPKCNLVKTEKCLQKSPAGWLIQRTSLVAIYQLISTTGVTVKWLCMTKILLFTDFQNLFLPPDATESYTLDP